MADKLADDHLPTCNRVAQQQQQRAALAFTDDRVVGHEQRNQWHQEDAEARKAHHGHGQCRRAHRSRRRASEQNQRERQRRHQRRRGEHPAVAQSIAQLLPGNGQDGVHAVSSRRRKCA